MSSTETAAWRCLNSKRVDAPAGPSSGRAQWVRSRMWTLPNAWPSRCRGGPAAVSHDPASGARALAARATADDAEAAANGGTAPSDLGGVAGVAPPFPPGDYDVTVVGSGPGGLQTSYWLRRFGVQHAVLSRDGAPAGM